MRSPWLFVALMMVLAVAAVSPAAPAAAQEDTATAQLQEEIAGLQKQIRDLQDKVDAMLGASEQEERNKLRAEIRVLERQLRIKMMQMRNVTKSAGDRRQDEIRRKYRERIEAVEAQRTTARREAIQRFEGMLAQTGEENMDPGVMFKLAQLYFEEAHYQYERQMDAYDQSLEAGHDPGQPPLHDYSRSIDLYRKVIERFPRYGNADAAHYLLAYCLTESGDEDGALAIYGRLIEHYGDSKFVAESHVRMGEIYFDRGELDRNAYEQAISHYQQVTPDSRFYDKALYKLGWTYYKMANVNDQTPLDEAVKYFRRVLKYYQSRPTKRLTGGDDLRKESLDYIAISFSDFGDGGLDRADRYFQSTENDEWDREVLRKMAEVYFAADDYDNGRKAAKLYLDRYPADPKNPQVHMKIVESYEKEGDIDKAVAESERTAALYGPESAWAKQNKVAKEDISRADRIRMANLFASATYHHERAQNLRADPAAQRAEFDKAIASYVAFTTGYPDAKNHGEAMFNLAEAYYYTEQYPEAATAYQSVAALGPEDKNYDSARFAYVKSLEMQLEKEGGLPNKDIRDRILGEGGTKVSSAEGESQKLTVVPVSATAQAYIDALVDYAPEAKGKSSPDKSILRAGYVLFWFGHTEEANKYFERVMAEFPGTESAQTAKFYALEGAKLKGDLEKFQRIIESYPSANPEMREKELGMASTAGLILAGKLADDGKHREAIDAYLEAYNKNPQSKDAPVALHNSAVILENKLNRLSEANTYLVKVAEEYPSYEKAAEDFFHAAVNYERLAEFDQAKDLYGRFYGKFPKHPRAKDALYNATLLAVKEHDFAMAQDYARRYADGFPDANDAGEVAFLVAKGYERAGDKGSAEAAYSEFVSRFTNDPVRLIEAYAFLGDAASGRGDSAEATKNFNLAVAVYDKFGGEFPEARKYAAKSKFLLTEPAWQEYQTIKFTGNVEMDATVLVEKAEKFKVLKDAYEQVAAYADLEWFTAALHQIGMIHREFSESLFRAPVPEGADAGAGRRIHDQARGHRVSDQGESHGSV
ncbi:MAG: tetratricopeptide repeat protein [Deltaproteobacteria bacterium]|nr:tetratricopeptide repeat protein [Deltaproteobacteria bacterium]